MDVHLHTAHIWPRQHNWRPHLCKSQSPRRRPVDRMAWTNEFGPAQLRLQLKVE
jgi:hypothetical protein